VNSPSRRASQTLIGGASASCGHPKMCRRCATSGQLRSGHSWPSASSHEVWKHPEIADGIRDEVSPRCRTSRGAAQEASGEDDERHVLLYATRPKGCTGQTFANAGGRRSLITSSRRVACAGTDAGAYALSVLPWPGRGAEGTPFDDGERCSGGRLQLRF